jgi:uncharacterized membrane protein
MKPPDDVVPAHTVRDALVDEIKKDHPDWDPQGYICLHDLDEYRSTYVLHSLEEEKGELSELENDVIEAVKQQELMAKNLNKEFDISLTTGQRIADKVAEFGGSWSFIIMFGVIILIWITINSILLLTKHFDPYPFILLNLLLSCLASMQAPIIMMSQNRQEAKDRMRSEHDYQVNLKAELEIRNLSQKMDHLLNREWQRLMEIQEIQMDLIREMADKAKNGKGE